MWTLRRRHASRVYDIGALQLVHLEGEHDVGDTAGERDRADEDDEQGG